MKTSSKKTADVEVVPTSKDCTKEMSTRAESGAFKELRVVELNWVKTPIGMMESWEACHPVIGSYQITRDGYEAQFEISTPFLAGKTTTVFRDNLEAAKGFAAQHLESVARSLIAYDG